MKIVLITTTQPAANPRIVKEADTFAEAGHDVTVLYCYVTDWAQIADEEILQNVKWKFKLIGGNRKASILYQWTRLKYGICKRINSVSKGTLLAEEAHARCYYELLKSATKINADIYIGHNPGAMAIAANAAKINNAKAGFDFEDYHRGEYSHYFSAGYLRQVYLENLYVATFQFLTVASPLIKKQVINDFPSLTTPIINVINCFSIKNQVEFRFKEEKNKLKICWFSQHVGKNRGLELFIKALQEINDDSIELTLIGNCTPGNKIHFEDLAGNFVKNIFFIDSLSPHKLLQSLPMYDIGLALETGFNKNNDIALSNKILSYLLAGNALITSETSMQKIFNEEFKVGQSFPLNDLEKLKDCILYFKDSEHLSHQRQHNYDLAKNLLNWENESKKLLAVIE